MPVSIEQPATIDYDELARELNAAESGEVFMIVDGKIARRNPPQAWAPQVWHNHNTASVELDSREWQCFGLPGRHGAVMYGHRFIGPELTRMIAATAHNNPGCLFSIVGVELRSEGGEAPSWDGPELSGWAVAYAIDYDALGAAMNAVDIDTVFEVVNGRVVRVGDEWAPEVLTNPQTDIDIDSPWQCYTGMTGQDGYHGAVMHPSEFIGGGIAQRIVETARDASGRCVFVAVVVNVPPGDDEDPDPNGEYPEPAGWALAWKDLSLIHTYADGFGCWHARVPAGEDSREVARLAILRELQLRESNVAESRIGVELVENGQQGDMVVYREVDPDEANDS